MHGQVLEATISPKEKVLSSARCVQLLDVRANSADLLGVQAFLLMPHIFTLQIKHFSIKSQPGASGHNWLGLKQHRERGIICIMLQRIVHGPALSGASRCVRSSAGICSSGFQISAWQIMRAMQVLKSLSSSDLPHGSVEGCVICRIMPHLPPCCYIHHRDQLFKHTSASVC